MLNRASTLANRLCRPAFAVLACLLAAGCFLPVGKGVMPDLKTVLTNTEYVLEYDCIIHPERPRQIAGHRAVRIYSLDRPIDLSDINEVLSKGKSVSQRSSWARHERWFDMCLRCDGSLQLGMDNVVRVYSRGERILWPPDGNWDARDDADCSVDEFRKLLRDLEQVSASARESLLEQRIPLKGK